MTFFSIRFARLAALSVLLITAGCTINTYSSKDPSSGGEVEKDKPKKEKPKKKEKKPAKDDKDDDKEAKPEKPKPEKEKDPKPEKPKPEKDPKPPEVEKPASKPDKPKDEPVVEKPKDEPPPVDKPAPQPQESKIVLPIAVALDAIEKEIDSLLPLTDKKDWTQVTKGDESPKAEIKYVLWRSPIKLSLDGHTFRIVVPVRYAATVRAQMKNPLTKDWFWIAKEETWGTKVEPQQLTAHFDATVRVTDDWKIESDVKLVKLEHGNPPAGEICKNVGVKVCVAKNSIAGEVREGIDKRLEPKLRKALDKVSAKVEKAFDVRKRAEKVWSALQKPQSLPAMWPIWLVVRPTAVAVGQPELEGSNVVLDIAIEGRLSVEPGDKPKVEIKPLPKITEVKGPRGFHVSTELRVPRASMSSSLDRALKGLEFQGKNKSRKISVVRAEVLGQADGKHPHRLTLKVAFGTDSKDEIELQGDLVYDAARQRLAFEDIKVTPSSQAVASGRLAGYDIREIEKALAKKAHWDLSEHAAPLQKVIVTALDTTLRGQATVRGELKELDVQKFEMTPESIAARVMVGGTLEVQVDTKAKR
jgi:hypothetical protein